MFTDNTDESWETLGRTDPYYGVLTSAKFRNSSLDEEARAEFFSSGKYHMTMLLSRIEEKFGAIAKGRALDFGCGVGRLALPLADEAAFSQVVGMDISQSMLNEARKNADMCGVNNLSLLISDDSLTMLEGNFDFIHSYIVLQHIPLKRGEKIIRQLLSRLTPGGVAALQMPFAKKAGQARRLANLIRVHVRPLHIVGNILQGRPWREPPMQMNCYNMNAILQVVCECGFPEATIELMVEGRSNGLYLLVQKPS